MNKYIGSLLGIIATTSLAAQQGAKPVKSPDQDLPPHITRLTYSGERADGSHDGKKILFLEKTFGEVFEIDLQTKIVRSVTQRYFHEGHAPALYLANWRHSSLRRARVQR